MYPNAVVISEITADSRTTGAGIMCIFEHSERTKEESNFSERWKSTNSEVYFPNTEILPYRIFYNENNWIIVA